MNRVAFKYFVLLFWVFCIPTIILSQNILIPEGTSLKNCFKTIEKQSELSFFYSDDEINTSQTVKTTLEFPVMVMIEKLSEELHFQYEILDQRIIVKPSRKEINISGKVLDKSNKNPIPGVNIYLRNQESGTISDANGEFSLKMNRAQGTLIFSFIGYKNYATSISKDTTLNILLEPDITSINEVIIVAYGEESRDLITGAINTIYPNSILSSESSENINRVIQASTTGLWITNNAGTPGSSVNVKMRGVGSINAKTSPLYIIDGIPIIHGDYSQIEFSGQVLDAVSDINGLDIESITILKDAASTALYGSRASNGVILMNTKKGDKENSRIAFRTNLGFNTAPKKLDLLNASEWMTVVNEEYERQGETAPFSEHQIQNPEYNTDWLDQTFQSGLFQNYHLSLSGGTPYSTYYISGLLRDEEGIIIGTDLKKYGIRLNYSHNLTENIELSFRTSTTSTAINRVEGDQSLNGPLPNAISMPPVYPVYNEDLTYFDEGPYANPLSIAYEEKNLARVFRSLSSFDVTYTINSNLSLKTITGYDFYRLREESYAPNTTRQGSKYNGYGIEASSDASYISNNTFLTFEKKKSNYMYKITSGINIENLREHFTYMRGQDFPGGNIQYLDAAASSVSTRSFSEQASLQSAFARTSIVFHDKYVFSSNIRMDGSSRFGENNRYGLFPSASAMWYISKEKFLSQALFLDYLKLRASIGQTGNDRIGNYLHFNLFQTGDNYNGLPGISPYQLSNKSLKWETTTHYNLGLDLAVFTNVRLTIDTYYKLTRDLLLEKPMPASSGFEFVLTNIGQVENYGLELDIEFHKEFNQIAWLSNLIFTSNRNNVVELYNNQPIRNLGRAKSSIEVGKPISFFYGFNALGVDSETGNLIYEDVVKDGVIDDQDRKYIGSPHPRFFGGYLNSFSFKNFTLSILLDFMYGNKIYNGTRFYRESFSDKDNMLRSVLERWKNPGDRTSIPKFSSDNELMSSRYIEDGSYLRIKNIQINYDISNLFHSQLKKFNLFISLENIYTLTKYSGMDPEVNYHGGNDIIMGTDFFTCPKPKTYSAGLCVQF